MASAKEGASRPFHPDDLVVWPDGTYATLEDFQNGEFNWRSDDVGTVNLDDVERLRELGLTEFIGA